MKRKTKKRKRNLKIVVSIIISIIFFIFILELINGGQTKNITIMIDSGHGGAEDNLKGAKISTGGREVTLNNSLSLLISKYLEEEGYTVAVTRDLNIEDEHVSLGQRCEIANELMPDLLMSVHHDSISDKSVTGFSLYYSSYRPNLDMDDVYVLYKNKEYKFLKEEIIGGRSNVFFQDNSETRKVISGQDNYKVIDKSPHEISIRSQEFAEILFTELEDIGYMQPLHGSRERAIIDNDLRITRSTNVPSILIEAGFMSNVEEAKQISNKENQEEFARRVVQAVNRYFNQP
ncbi:hypothetical protein GC105_06315 [Alkalibaculum sp. M08DMB]|uniref:MurNAc-LAA domain-containing protein n=1 Tax=Alkalibaculum sporogenes TaxID=2655001 RepID=A0A6A7K7D4_9FIRM|nr:N-acetylmuramoyl-L-alanine amidase [Alkalibaculum sporogenes]MPW25398.1 hypothetical protein [Alkalibaculum sporogenes]